jgi:hypothetical protein
MHIFSRRPWLRVLVSALIGTMAVGTSVLVRAQSPSPTGYLENVDPEYPPSPLAPYPGSMGIVVEGLGYGSCSGPTLQQIESVTEQSIEDHLLGCCAKMVTEPG